MQLSSKKKRTFALFSSTRRYTSWVKQLAITKVLSENSIKKDTVSQKSPSQLFKKDVAFFISFYTPIEEVNIKVRAEAPTRVITL